MKVERYQAYKDSEVKWLGDVPEIWKITHIKRICKKVTDGAHTSPDISSDDYPFLTVVNLKNGVLDFENCLYTSSTDYQKLVRNGCQPKLFDVLYSKDGTISESVAIYEDREFIVGSSFIILSPKHKSINSTYLSYLLSSFIMRFQASIYVKGASLPRISIFNVAKLLCVVPTLSEQKTIAHYLDTKTAQIDRKIDLLTQKATPYGNLKQSLINETVTRGIDKSVPMKDSGIDAIGEVPEHWGILLLKDLASKSANSFVDGPFGSDLKSNEYTDKGIPLIQLNNIGIGLHLIQNLKFISEEKALSLSRHRAYAGEIAIAKMAEPVARAAIISDHFSMYIIVADCIKLTANCKISYPKFLVYALNSLGVKSQAEILSNGTTRVRINLGIAKILKVVLPPLSEQKAIADYLDTKTAQIDQIIQTINTQIEKLKELRKTLINDVVTGKIRVTEPDHS